MEQQIAKRTLETEMKIENRKGLCFNFLKNGSVKNIQSEEVNISLKNATVFSKLGTNIYLRKENNGVYEHKAIMGSDSECLFAIEESQFRLRGEWDGIEYTCSLQLSEKSASWQWRIVTKNTTQDSLSLDLIYVQDVGLRPISNALVNEYYVSQYLDRQIFKDKDYGDVICCRQNFSEGIGNPWLMLFCDNYAMSASTDGIQFFGNSFKKSNVPKALFENRLQGECSAELAVLALQEKPFELSVNDSHITTFSGTYIGHHPEETSQKDLNLISSIRAEFESESLFQNNEKLRSAGGNIFNHTALFPAEDLTRSDIYHFFGNNLRNIEEKEGEMLSFFYKENYHVVLKAKECLVDRPHGHIMQAKMNLTPDEDMMSTTTYAYGVFNSHMTQGNTNYNRFLSICSSQFNLEPQTGQRIFVELDKKKYILGVPSAYEMGLNHCRWIYKLKNTCLEVRTWTSVEKPEVHMDFKVLTGAPVKLLVTNHLAQDNEWYMVGSNSNGHYVFKPKSTSLIASKFADAQFGIRINSEKYKIYGDEILHSSFKSGGDMFFNIELEQTSSFSMSFIGEISNSYNTNNVFYGENEFQSNMKQVRRFHDDLLSNLSFETDDLDINCIQEILPWYGSNALIHLLTPHGLEQFDGAAWGTRDTTQGPFELLLYTQKYEEVKSILRILFSNQNTDGGWPQWWMFDSYSEIRASSAHGDVHHWSIIALGDYIKATGDIDFLTEKLPYYSKNTSEKLEKTTILEHVERATNMLINSFLPKKSFVPFGGGDWNDSMQPVNKSFADRLISSWTVALNYQAFKSLQSVYELLNKKQKSTRLSDISDQIKLDFNKYLVKDGVVAGHGLLEDDQSIDLLLHPTDERTNIHYRLLPMIRGIISGIFTQEQAKNHLDIIQKYLKGPDGARLMNQPPKYSGGVQTIFKRAESSSYFGREIGIMYMHAHLRYAEVLALMGEADDFIKALRQANPVEYRKVVCCGDFRQSNCYYSSSDVTFKNRYEADKRYEDVKLGDVKLKGGWRIYSSGPGIYIGLIIRSLLGLRTEFGKVILDPVIPKGLDGFSAKIVYNGFPLTLKFLVKENVFHPKKCIINGKTARFSYADNRYRRGGAVMSISYFEKFLHKTENHIEIYL